MSVQDDRRRQTRLRVLAFAALETRGALNASNQALGSVIDVSRTGIGLETGQPPFEGQQVHLRVALDEEIHELTTRATRVIRTEHPNYYRVGLDWGDCSPEQSAFLERVFSASEQPQV